MLEEVKIRICKECGIGLIKNNNWYPSYEDHHNYICKKCSSKYAQGCAQKPEVKIRRAEDRLEVKRTLFDILGNKCECCGFADFSALSIDHIDGNGAAHRKSLNMGGGSNFYVHVLKNIETIDQYRILCHNCNLCLGLNGYCPHQEQKDRSVKKSIGQFERGQCRFCGLILNSNVQYKYHSGICKECFNIDLSNRAFAIKKQVIENYGGCCATCKENQPEFLVIDHINNDGAEDRRNRGLFGLKMYRWLIKNGCPIDEYQLLCSNCNWKKQLNNIAILK